MSNTRSGLNTELEALLARVRTLATAPQRSDENAPSPPTEGVRKEAGGSLSREFDELVEVLKREIDDLPPMTCLAIFGLGVLTGRLLST